MSAKWKDIVSALRAMHQETGAGFVRVADGGLLWPSELPDSLEMVNVSPDEELLEVDGTEVPSKEVKRWLWRHRKSRSLKRVRAILWSVYDQGKTVVGVGAVVDRRVLERAA